MGATAGSPVEWYSKKNHSKEEHLLEEQMHFYGRAAMRELLQYGDMHTGTIEPLSKNVLAEMGIHPTCTDRRYGKLRDLLRWLVWKNSKCQATGAVLWPSNLLAGCGTQMIKPQRIGRPM